MIPAMATLSESPAINEPPTIMAVGPAGCALPADWKLADLQAHLGDVPAERIRLTPPPGCATEADVVQLQEAEGARCELIDGVLVEKTVGAYESALAFALGSMIKAFVRARDLGVVFGEQGAVRTVASQVRMPDVCYVSRDRFPGGRIPRHKVIPVAPDLAIEILSEGNTRQEMDRKLAEYFQAGTRLVWYIDPEQRTARAFTSQNQFTNLGEDDVLDGGDVLPGFRVRLGDVFTDAGPFEDTKAGS
jgi:Uma2 family endonuclease